MESATNSLMVLMVFCSMIGLVLFILKNKASSISMRRLRPIAPRPTLKHSRRKSHCSSPSKGTLRKWRKRALY